MTSPLFRSFGRKFGSTGGAAYRAKAREVSRRMREAAVLAGVGDSLPTPAGGRPTPTWARSALNSLWDVMASAGQGPLGELVQSLMRPHGQALASPERELAGALNLVADLA